ncbi:hypothetical protein EN45_058290 [Penicillium chrysogenum]|uniref:Uncharacterized protein n=1 Tax=Penicillium chrysogenum TaxID=5076 RepID=A0A167SJX7_PENCH|nr:hypothetical protein EN45_058290 [Penicillium chrysogenum]
MLIQLPKTGLECLVPSESSLISYPPRTAIEGFVLKRSILSGTVKIRTLWYVRLCLLSRAQDIGRQSQVLHIPIHFGANETLVCWKVLVDFVRQRKAKSLDAYLSSTPHVRAALQPELISVASGSASFGGPTHACRPPEPQSNSSAVSRPPTSPAAKESNPRRRGSWTTELNPTKGAARTSRDDEEDQALEDEL